MDTTTGNHFSIALAKKGKGNAPLCWQVYGKWILPQILFKGNGAICKKV